MLKPQPPIPATVTQFHAVALLHGLRSQDRLAVSKLVTSLVRGSVRSPLAQCLLVRYVAQVCLWQCRSYCESDAYNYELERHIALRCGHASATTNVCPYVTGLLSLAGDCGVGAAQRDGAPAVLRLPGGLPAAQGRDGHLRGRSGDLRHAGGLLPVGALHPVTTGATHACVHMLQSASEYREEAIMSLW
jgi:hypothetical protein